MTGTFRKIDGYGGAMRGIMCSRYALWAIDDLGGRFLIVDPAIGFRSHFTIAPQTKNPVVVATGNGNHLLTMQWGLVPNWAQDPRATPHPVNARAETLLEKPMFRHLLNGNRCLIPANGFYEWKKEGTRKLPFYFHRRDDSLFAFAGLYDTWRSASGETLLSYAIITTEANELVAPVHPRMPAILTREAEQRWLSPDPLRAEDIPGILAPADADEMESYLVSDGHSGGVESHQR